jgi:hypothetical protein
MQRPVALGALSARGTTDGHTVIASAAKQSSFLCGKTSWIASSLSLLAMTIL